MYGGGGEGVRLEASGTARMGYSHASPMDGIWRTLGGFKYKTNSMIHSPGRVRELVARFDALFMLYL